MCFTMNRKLGFAEFTIWRFAFVFVWGWRGNLYGRAKYVFRIDWLKTIKSIQIDTDYCLTTINFFSWRSATWNSEHIAIKLGRLKVCDEVTPEHYYYKGILGEHIAV